MHYYCASIKYEIFKNFDKAGGAKFLKNYDEIRNSIYRKLNKLTGNVAGALNRISSIKPQDPVFDSVLC